MRKKQGWLIYQEEEIVRNQFSIRVMCENAERLRIPLEVKTWQWWKVWKNDRWEASEENADFKIRELPGYVINRSRDACLAEWFEVKGIRVFNSSSVTRIANDKEQTLEFAESLGIPTLEWKDGESLYASGVSGTEAKVGEKTREAKDVKDVLKGTVTFPLVAKSCGGHGGTEVFWVENATELSKVKRLLDGRKWMIQRPASELGKDVRVYAVGNRIIQAMLRVSETDFRSNFCLGGQAEPYELGAEEQYMVQKILEELKTDYVGIDFLFDQGEMVLNEIEDAVGARMLYSGTDLDILKNYMEYIKKELIE